MLRVRTKGNTRCSRDAKYYADLCVKRTSTRLLSFFSLHLLYRNMDTMTDQLVDIVSALRDASIEVPAIGLSLPILELLHAILITYTYRTALKENHADIGWGQGLLATIVMSAGGGSTASLLLGNPLSILKSNRFWGVYGVCTSVTFVTGLI